MRTRYAAGRGPVAVTAAAFLLLLLASLQSGAARAAEPPAPSSPPSPPSPSRVSVDFGSSEGRLPRAEKYNNFGNVTAWPEQRADDVDFYNEQGLHGDIYRVWLSSVQARDADVFNLCDLATNRCDLSKLDAYLTEASAVSDSLLIDLNPTDFIEGKRPLRDLQPLLELIIRSVKEKYPRVKYVEAFNEPDWQYHGQQRNAGRPADQTTLQPDGLYRYYVPFYKAVDNVNQHLRRADRLKLGGPALSIMDPKWVKPFLDAFAADKSPRKRLDFLSYHAYLSWDEDYKTPTMYREDLRVVASQREVLRGWLKERRLDRHLPAFVTETGIYPGPAYDDTDPTKDYIRQATAMATYSYYYADQPHTYMFNWCVRHSTQERKDQLVTRTPNGPLTDTLTPHGNMLLMQAKMKDIRVSAVADGLEGDNGVYTMASKDRTGASVMAWN